MSENGQRRLRVNPTLCDGVGYCAEIVPELITLDDWGYPVVDSRSKMKPCSATRSER
jgi:ferredoxin